MMATGTAAPVAPVLGRGKAANGPLTEQARQDVRRTLLALLASGIGVLPLCELLSDRAWLIDVWLSMIVAVGPAALLRTRRPPAASQIWVGVALLAPWLTFRFVSAHALFGVVPLRASWHDVHRLMTSLQHTTSEQAAPIHSTPAVRLTLCALLALVAALVDLIAVVGRRGALAGVPLLIVFTVSGAVPRQVVSWWLFALAAGAFLILLALDSSDDLNRWGHYVPRPGQDRRRASGAAGAISAQRIAVAAIALAVILPVFAPADSRNLVANLFHNGSSGGGDGAGFGAGGSGGAIDPFVALKGQLNRKKPLRLFDVSVQQLSGPRGAQPFYLRTNVLSQFVGTGWRAGPSGPSEPVDATDFASVPGTSLLAQPVSFIADINVTGLSSNPPVFALPTRAGGLSGDARWSLQDQLVVGTSVSSGDQYQLAINQAAPTQAELRDSSGRDPATDRWLQLPPVAAYVSALVRRLTAGKQGAYAKARAISDYFADPANGFTYSLSTAGGNSGDQLVDFLKAKIGYCQQYAAAMGVLLRVAGVPARVVLGYTHQPPDANGQFSVTTDDAHAWVEAYFSGIGWIPFDATPLAGISGGSANDLPWAPHRKTTAGGAEAPTGRASSRPSTGGASASATSNASAGTGSHDGGSPIFGLVLTSLLALTVVALLTPWAVRQRRRRYRLRLARGGDTEAIWTELFDTAVDLGYVWSPARTPRQVARWLAPSAGAAAGSLQTLAAAVELGRYAPPGSGPPPDGLLTDFAAVRAGLSATRPTGRRLRSRLWPASLGWVPRGLPWPWPLRRQH